MSRQASFLPLTVAQVSGPLGYENKIIGYIYLVDSNCKIRWAGCSGATEDEVQSLRTATEVLMKRVGEGK